MIRTFLNSIRARLVKYFRSREIIKTLKVAHAQELAHTPGEQWPLIRQQHMAEIQAVKDGKWDIIDRRSWAYPYIPECTGPDTDILTKRGWIQVTEMRKDDLFATRNKKGELEYQKATKLVKSWYEGPMERFKGRGLDLLLTPNHRMLGRKVFRKRGISQKESKGQEEFLTARAIEQIKPSRAVCRFEAPISSHWKGKLPASGKKVTIEAYGGSKYSHPHLKFEFRLKDWVAFLGIYLAEGTHTGAFDGVKKHDKKVKTPIFIQAIAAAADHTVEKIRSISGEGRSNAFRIRIAQRKTSPSYSDIKALLTRMGVNYSAGRDGDFEFSSKALWQELAPLGNTHTKNIPQWVKELPPKYLRVLIDWMMKGDGHWEYKGTCPVYNTVSKQLADDFQEVCLKAGYAASVRIKERKNVVTKLGRMAGPFYNVAFSKRTHQGLPTPIREQYGGYVYCVSVPNQTICIRRRSGGLAVWTGNSLHRLNQPIL